MSVYDIDKLMDETRRIAAEYRRSTGTVLPVAAELARYDAIRLLELKASDGSQRAVDATKIEDQLEIKIQVKSRVIFEPGKSGARIGQLNMDAAWDSLILVLFNAEYLPTHIYQITKSTLEQSLTDAAGHSKNKRGAMSLGRFMKIAEVIWSAEDKQRS